MKRILTLGIVLLTVNSLLPAQEITFSETKFNWGTVREQDGNVSHDFRFVNTGDKPLTIKNIITGCGCTSSEWTEKAYQPGEEGIIRLVYHPQGRTENDINLVTEIYTNRAAKGVVTLEMAGKITRETPSYSARYNPANGKRSQSPTYIPQDEYEQILERIREELYAKTTTQQADRATENYCAPCFRKVNGATSIMPAFPYQLGTGRTPETFGYNSRLIYRQTITLLR